MSRPQRRYEIAAAAPVVAVFAGLYAWVVPTGGPNRSTDMFWLAVLFLIPTFFWLVASSLLVHHWWERAGARMSTMDAPGHLLAGAVATLPEPRQRWGEAMLGELDQVRGRPARWRFALSCARAVLFLPARPRWHLGAGAAVVFTLGVLASTRLDSGALPALWLLFGPMLTFAVVASIAAAAGRSFRAGVQAGVWTAIAVMPLTLALGVFEALRQYSTNGTWTFAGDTTSAGFSLGFAFATSIAIPLIGFPFAVFAATVAATLPTTQPSQPP